MRVLLLKHASRCVFWVSNTHGDACFESITRTAMRVFGETPGGYACCSTFLQGGWWYLQGGWIFISILVGVLISWIFPEIIYKYTYFLDMADF